MLPPTDKQTDMRLTYHCLRGPLTPDASKQAFDHALEEFKRAQDSDAYHVALYGA